MVGCGAVVWAAVQCVLKTPNISWKEGVATLCCDCRLFPSIMPPTQPTNHPRPAPTPHPPQEGLAHLCLVGSTCTLTRAKVEANVPRKRGAAAAGYDKAMEGFYDKVWGTSLCDLKWARNWNYCDCCDWMHSSLAAPTLLPATCVRACVCVAPGRPPPAQVFTAVVRHVDWDIVRCLVIAGPGFAKDQFREYLDRGGWV